MPVTAAAPSISHIGQIAIPANDIDRAVDFYRNKLGLPFLFRAPNLAFFQCGGTRLMLDIPGEKEFQHPSSIIYFSVADIRASHAQMKAQGVEFRDQPHMIARLEDHELWMTFFQDSEGNTLALMSEVRG